MMNHSFSSSTSRTKLLTSMALFLALIIVAGFISIPLPLVGVPIVMQNMLIMMSGGFLGKKYGTLTNLVFLSLVFVGFPLLAGGRGGPVIFLSPSSGFLLGYLLCPLIIGIFLDKLDQNKFINILLAYIIGGVLIIDVAGSFSLAYYSHTSWFNGLKMVAVFLPMDLAKAFLAALIHKRLFPHLSLGKLK